MYIKALKFKQKKNTFYIGFIPASRLERLVCDNWQFASKRKGHGYQRRPESPRIKSIADYLHRDEAIMPVAGLLNIRDKEDIRFSNGELHIPDDVDIWVVDMQHRWLGIQEALKHRSIPPDFGVPVVIMVGLSRAKEAQQFYIVNTYAKRMDVALTRRLMIEHDEIEELISDKRSWEIPATKTAILLNEKLKNPWKYVLRRPNEESDQSRFIATEKSFVNSLRTLYAKVKPGGSIASTAKKLAYFWNAIAVTVPAIFSLPIKKRQAYLLQKTLGMNAFNLYIVRRFIQDYKVAQYEEKLRGLQKLGAIFWLSSNKRKGAARFGSGFAGQKNLADFLIEKLDLQK